MPRPIDFRFVRKSRNYAKKHQPRKKTNRRKKKYDPVALRVFCYLHARTIDKHQRRFLPPPGLAQGLQVSPQWHHGSCIVSDSLRQSVGAVFSPNPPSTLISKVLHAPAIPGSSTQDTFGDLPGSLLGGQFGVLRDSFEIVLRLY